MSLEQILFGGALGFPGSFDLLGGAAAPKLLGAVSNADNSKKGKGKENGGGSGAETGNNPQWTWGYGPDMSWPPPAVPQQPVPGADPMIAAQAASRMQGLMPGGAMPAGMNYSQLMPQLYQAMMQPYQMPAPPAPPQAGILDPGPDQWAGLLGNQDFLSWLGTQGYGLLGGSDNRSQSPSRRVPMMRDQNWYDQRGKG